MSRPIILPNAQEDLLGLWEFIAQDNVDAADRVLGLLEEAFLRLAEHPEMSHRRPDLTAAEIRFFTVRGYTILYRPDVQPIEIVRIVGRGRDTRGLLH